MTIPAELKRSTPRPVALTPWGKAAVLSFGLLAVAFIAETAWFCLHGDRSSGFLRVAGGFGLYFLLALSIKLWEIPRQMRLLSGGRAVVARTTGEYKRVKFTGRNIRRYRLECDFTFLSGARSKTTVVTGQWLPGNTEIVILYDPDNPAKAVMYPARMLKIDS